MKNRIIKYLENFILNNENTSPLLGNTNNKAKTKITNFYYDNKVIKIFTNEFWTSRQRQSNSIHEISYRACFKAQLPGFFIKLLTKKNDIVYDPFTGRGTTIIEAGLLERNIISNDINPLSKILCYPRLFIPDLKKIELRLNEIEINYDLSSDIDLSMFYHKKTEAEIVSLRNYLISKKKIKKSNYIDEWIRMIATNRLTGHSKGFFSVYTLPPNQAVSQKRQIQINEKRKQKPEYRNIKKLILNKSKFLLKDINIDLIKNLKKSEEKALFLNNDAGNTKKIKNNQVFLTVTSPPFLDIVQYAEDNWLRCWFNNIDIKKIEKKITMSRKIEKWTNIMQKVFNELYRITKINGWVAFEVGEVRNGKIKLDEYVVPLGINAGFKCVGIMINSQIFSKTSNCWGVKNNKKGTNTNRIVLFIKEA